jgi:hypothetical protein
MTKKNEYIEEMNYACDIEFIADGTGHLSSLNKEFQGKDNLVIETSDNTKAFEVKLRLWENRLKVKKFTFCNLNP